MKIRTATREDLKELTAIEAACFPPSEAADEKTLSDRLANYPNHFWLLLEDNQIIGFVNGMATQEEHLTDEMYEMRLTF